MYILALITFFAILFLGVSQTSAPMVFFNPFSVLIILFVTVPMILSSGLLLDLKRAFKIIMNKKTNYTKLELLRSLESIKLTMKLLIYSSIFGLLIGLFSILIDCNDVTKLGPNLFAACLPFLYALFGNLIFLPIRSKIKVLILTIEDKE